MNKVKVIISDEQKEITVPRGIRMLIRRCCNAVLQAEKFGSDAEVSVCFVDNERIHELNAQYRNVDRETDVLSFPMGENGEYDTNMDTGAKILGDIVISVPKAMEQAKAYMLHLLGYDHENGGIEQVHMREKEEEVLTKIGLKRDNSYYMGD